jgi:hypothetical protein
MSIPIINNPKGRTFKSTVQAMLAARAELPQSFVFNQNLTSGSKLSAGMTVGPDNRPRRIQNSDPSVHFGKSVIVKALSVVSVDSEDEPEEGSDVVELSLIEPVIAEVGEDEPESKTIPEEGEGVEVEVGESVQGGA